MSGNLVGRIPFAKIVIFLAVAFGIGCGLCGLDFYLAAHNIGKSTEEFGVGPLDGLSLMVILLSAFGLIITVIAWVLAALLGRTGLRRADNGPQRLFTGEEDPKNDDPR